MGVLALVVIGPIGTYCGDGLSWLVLFIQKYASWVAVALMAAFMPLIVMTGMHWPLPDFLGSQCCHP
nr:hypothetical protein [Lacticaseibacillus manihotivorans]